MKVLLVLWRKKNGNKWLQYHINVCIDKLDDIVDKYNNILHRKIKVKPNKVKSSKYIHFKVEMMIKILNLKLVTLWEYQNIKIFLQKGNNPKWSENVFLTKKFTVPRTSVIEELNREEIVGTFYKKKLQKTNQADLRNKKITKNKDDKSYVTWKDYNSLFNSWIYKKDIHIKWIIIRNQIFLVNTK